MRKVFIGGNWKSNGDMGFLRNHMNNVINKLKFDTNQCEVVVAPTFIHLMKAKQLLDRQTGVEISAQNCSLYKDGAYTGEVSAKQIRDFGLKWVILGHSERRALFGESNEIVGKKVKMALDNGLKVIGCIGEKLQEREAGKTMSVILSQMDQIARNTHNWQKMVIAYEPVWAIGTGKTASPEQAQEVHGELRNWVETKIGKQVSDKVQIIYGGSVNDKNAATLIQKPDIDGFLVGGASLKSDFTKIVNAYPAKF